MEKLNNLEFYKKNEDVMLQAIRRGLISLTIMDRITIYDFYKKQLLKCKKMEAIQNTCEEFHICQDNIYKSIRMLERRD